MCAPAVVGLSIDFESKYNKPAVPLVISDFATQEAEVAASHGMPGLRIQFFRGPVWGKTRDQLRRMIVEGNDPITNRPVMQELVEKFTTPLTDAEKRTGELKQSEGPATFTDTPDNLQQMFLEKRWTDFLPVVLPTEQRVDEMLKGTSHLPEEPLGKMTNSGVFKPWSYPVRTAAIAAVMAGCKPEYLPLILAVGSTGIEGVSVSDNGFVSALVINGDIRDEIGLNYGIGAMGPFAHANTTIGRAWNLLSINGGNCEKVGTTYMGTVGNPMNAINIVIAENEGQSPFEPFSVRLPGKGYKRGQNIVNLFSGWGVLSARNWKYDVWQEDMNFPQIIKDIFNDQSPSLFGACAVLSPPIANFVKDAGYDTVEKFTQWLMTPPAGQEPHFQNPNQLQIIVTGGTNNDYFSIGGLAYFRSVEIDPWR